MGLSPFHAYYKARKISNYTFGRDKLIAAFASADMEIYPYQVAAALFALRSPYLKGAILCDDGALGKSFEALLVIAQKFYEGKRHILLIVPTPLLKQWETLLEDHFSLPFEVLDYRTSSEPKEASHTNPFLSDGLILTTYHFAAERAEEISQVTWDIALFDEAHHLRRVYTGENKTASALKAATEGAFRLLLTATPMQNSIMDIYGLIHFIDEIALPEPDRFYKRYFRKPEYYPELSSRVSKFCFRTLRSQVGGYVKIPKRIPFTVEYALTQPEKKLYQLIESYLSRERKIAFPKMDSYDLTLMFYRTVSSSPLAFSKMLQGVEARLTTMDNPRENIGAELREIHAMSELALGIGVGAKGAELLKALKSGFSELSKKGAKKKALIFTENRTTGQALYERLDEHYRGKVLLYHGENSRNYAIIEQFKEEAQILMATDIAAEGFNLEFCSFVVNYDLPYNILTLEQRVSRCHRQGQQSDVLVLSFLNQDNFADVRMLELAGKRMRQFSGVFGMSDTVFGNFGADTAQAIDKARTVKTIERVYQETLSAHEDENQAMVDQAEASLFTSFTKKLAQRVAVSPQYIRDESKRLNDELWEITKYFFEGKWPFQIDEATRTLSCVGTPPKVFTGASMHRNEYSMDANYRPRSGKHTITGSLTRNILAEIFWKGIPDRGMMVVEGEVDPCTIGYYQVCVKPKGALWESRRFDVLVGQTADGRILSHEECAALMELPVKGFEAFGEPFGQRDGAMKPKPAEALDKLIDPNEFIRKAFDDMASAEAEEAEQLRAHAEDMKAELTRALDDLRIKVKTAEIALQKELPRLERIQAQKQVALLQKELKQREQNLFFNRIQIEQTLEERIGELTEKSQLTAEVKREFIVQIASSSAERFTSD